MKARAFALTLGILTAAGAHTQAQAQLLPDPAPRQPAQLEPGKPAAPDPFAGSHQPYPRVYGGNVAAQPNDHVFTGMRRDPRLIAGVEVAPNVAIEGGYLNLPDKGLHKVEPGKPADASIPLGEKVPATTWPPNIRCQPATACRPTARPASPILKKRRNAAWPGPIPACTPAPAPATRSTSVPP